MDGQEGGGNEMGGLHTAECGCQSPRGQSLLQADLLNEIRKLFSCFSSLSVTYPRDVVKLCVVK